MTKKELEAKLEALIAMVANQASPIKVKTVKPELPYAKSFSFAEGEAKGRKTFKVIFDSRVTPEVSAILKSVNLHYYSNEKSWNSFADKLGNVAEIQKSLTKSLKAEGLSASK